MSDSHLDPERVEVFYTELTAARAQVYVRLDEAPAGSGYEITGNVYGPVNKVAHSLAASCRLRDSGPGPAPLARAVVLDPVFWTHDTPALYRVQFEVTAGGKLVAQGERWLAFRGIGVQGRNLIRTGKRWVLRGVSLDQQTPPDWCQWRTCGADCLAPHLPAAAEIQSAGENGVLLIARLSENSDLAEQLRHLAQHPAVGVVILPDSALSESAADLRLAGPNLLLAQWLEPNGQWQPRPQADVVIAGMRNPAAIQSLIESCDRPIIWFRRADASLAVSESRAECDRLQRDLAPFGQFAGYIV